MRSVSSIIATVAVVVLTLFGEAGGGGAARGADADAGRFGRGLRPGERFVWRRSPGAMYYTLPRTVECWVKIGSAQDDVPILAYEPRTSIEHWAIYAAKGTERCRAT